MDKWYIYKITNTINNKSYVGQRLFRGNPNEDNYMGSGIAIKRAIKKYGKENFIKTILEDEIKLHEIADQMEINYIEKEDTISPNGYNIKKGGQLHYKHNEETKKIIKEKRKDQIIPRSTIEAMRQSNLNRECSEETKKKISEGNKGKSLTEEHKKQISVFFTGKKLTEEHKLKISNSLKGKTPKFIPDNNGRIRSDEFKKKLAKRKGYKIMIDDKIFDSYKEASIETGLERLTIRYRLFSNNFPNYKIQKINHE